MIYDATELNDEHREKIREELGAPNDMRESLTEGGVRSGWISVSEVSNGFLRPDHLQPENHHARIELRPTGLLLKLSAGDESFVWSVPYHRLAVYRTEGIALHGDGEFIRMDVSQDDDKAFLQKVQDRRNEYLEQFSYR